MANHPSVVGDGDLEWGEHSHGEKFGYRRKQLSRAAGGATPGGVSPEWVRGAPRWPTRAARSYRGEDGSLDFDNVGTKSTPRSALPESMAFPGPQTSQFEMRFLSYTDGQRSRPGVFGSHMPLQPSDTA
jgi:hypothetical protein